MRRSLSFLAILAAMSTSCGSSSSGGGPGTTNEDTGSAGDDTGNAADGTPTADTDPGADTSVDLGEYPPGPYGTSTGSVMADFDVSGYLNLDSSQLTNTAEYKTLKLSDIRAAAKTPYLFIHLVGFF